jgi:transposase-like protein
MKITIEFYCPYCQSIKIKKNGKKKYYKQNYMCKNCGRQFIGDHALTYKGCHSKLYKRIEMSLFVVLASEIYLKSSR